MLRNLPRRGTPVRARTRCATSGRLKRNSAGRIALAVLAGTGCFAYRPASLTPAPGARVRIVLREPQTVTAAAEAAGGTVRTWDRVLEARGTITAVSGDTIALRLGQLRTPAGTAPRSAGTVVLLPTGGIAGIQARRFEAGRTLLAGLGLSFLALTALEVALIVLVTRAAV